jgi:hypothetical protein
LLPLLAVLDGSGVVADADGCGAAFDDLSPGGFDLSLGLELSACFAFSAAADFSLLDLVASIGFGFSAAGFSFAFGLSLALAELSACLDFSGAVLGGSAGGGLAEAAPEMLARGLELLAVTETVVLLIVALLLVADVLCDEAEEKVALRNVLDSFDGGLLAIFRSFSLCVC